MNEDEVLRKHTLARWALHDTQDGLIADLEQGSHEMNNVASEEFAKKYSRFSKAFQVLTERLDDLHKELGGAD